MREQVGEVFRIGQQRREIDHPRVRPRCQPPGRRAIPPDIPLQLGQRRRRCHHRGMHPQERQRKPVSHRRGLRRPAGPGRQKTVNRQSIA